MAVHEPSTIGGSVTPVVTLDVAEVVAVLRTFANRVAADSDQLDALNVFPVADRDTGANMQRSLAAIVDAVDDASTAAEVADAVMDGALDGRGNSGLITGQFLSGWVSVMGPDGLVFTDGLAAGAASARRAVVGPVDGTMLTVADAVAARAREGGDVDALVAAAAAAVDATTEQLDVLAQHGVIDAGAAGLLHFFVAVSDVVGRRGLEPQLISCDVGLAEGTPSAMLPAEGQRVVGHEIRFRVPVSIVGADELRGLLSEFGSDVVVGSGVDELAAHLHVVDVDVAVSVISTALETRPGAKAISYHVEPLVESEPTGRAS